MTNKKKGGFGSDTFSVLCSLCLFNVSYVSNVLTAFFVHYCRLILVEQVGVVFASVSSLCIEHLQDIQGIGGRSEGENLHGPEGVATAG